MVIGCDEKRQARGWCNMHYLRYLNTGDAGPARRKKRKSGEGSLARGYKTVTVRGRKMLEQRYVMELHLGRPLWPDENVHHINGDRSDNRIENLELWSTWQPAGQRVADKVAWAREILARYDA
jgi:hypothetical protein